MESNLFISILTYTQCAHSHCDERQSYALATLCQLHRHKETVQGNNFDREGFIWQHLSSTVSAFPFQDFPSSSTPRMMVEERIRE